MVRPILPVQPLAVQPAKVVDGGVVYEAPVAEGLPEAAQFVAGPPVTEIAVSPARSYTPMPVQVVQSPTRIAAVQGSASYSPPSVTAAGSPELLMPRSSSFVPSMGSFAAQSAVDTLPPSASFYASREAMGLPTSVMMPRVNSFAASLGTMPATSVDSAGTKVVFVPVPYQFAGNNMAELQDVATAPTQVLPATTRTVTGVPAQEEEKKNEVSATVEYEEYSEYEEEDEGVMDRIRSIPSTISEFVTSTAATVAAHLHHHHGEPPASGNMDKTDVPTEGQGLQAEAEAQVQNTNVQRPVTNPSMPGPMQRVTPVIEDGQPWTEQWNQDEELFMWRQRGPLDLWLIDNSRLQDLTPGLGVRKTTEIANKDGQACIPWGTIIEGREYIPGQWIETMTRKGARFLPRYIQGVSVCGLYHSSGDSTNKPEPTANASGTEMPRPIIVEPTIAQTMPGTLPASIAHYAEGYSPRSVAPFDMRPLPSFPTTLGNYNVTVSGGIAALQGAPEPEVYNLYQEPGNFGEQLVSYAPRGFEQGTVAGRDNQEDVTSKLFSTISGVFVGSIGVVCNTKTGLIRQVIDERQAKKVGVRPGWTIKEVNGQPYNDGAMVKIIESKQPYQVTFQVPLTNLQTPISAPEPFAYEPPVTYFAGSGSLPPSMYVSTNESLPSPSSRYPAASGSFSQTGYGAANFAALQYSSSQQNLQPGAFHATRNITREEMLGAGYLVSGRPPPGAPSPISETQDIPVMGATLPEQSAKVLSEGVSPGVTDDLGQTKDAVTRSGY